MSQQQGEFRVDRCVCAGRDFAELLAIADKHGCTFEQLCQKTGCCRGCGFCAPYVQRVLLTRETVLPLMPQAAAMTGEQIEARVDGAGSAENFAKEDRPSEGAEPKAGAAKRRTRATG